MVVAGERIEASTVIWAAGVMASLAREWLNAKTDRSGRVIVNADLTIPGHPGVFVLGDAASAHDAHGRPLTGVATVAKQQDAYVAKRLVAELEGGPTPFIPLPRLRLARGDRA